MRSLVFLSSLVLLPAAASADGVLSGWLRTRDGAPLPQVVLVLKGASASRSVVTGPEGRFRSAPLPAGEYAVEVETPGFVLVPQPRVVVKDGEVRLDLVLEPAPVRERVVVSATRGEAAPSTLGVSVSALDRERIREREASSSLRLLQDLPGVAVARTGGIGAQGSAFVRGGESRFARVLVDGVPLNQPGGLFDFGGALPLELERVEVVRGAASSLYGTDALAGVLQFVTRRGDGPPELRLEADAGGFGWRRGQAATSGRRGAFDWNVGLLRLTTDNEQPNSAFEETAGAASLGAGLDQRTSLRVLLRAESSDLGTAGQTAFGRPDLDASFARDDLTLGARLRHARERSLHELRFGYARSEQLSLNPQDSGAYVPRFGDSEGTFPISDFPDPLGFQNDTERLSLGYQAELQAGSRHLVTAGLELEREKGEVGSRGDTLLSPERTNAGVYVQDRLVIGGCAYLTLGGRVERNDSYGTRAVPRVALALRLRGGPGATTLKASAGTGIKEPDFFQSFGVSFFAKGNPGLRPERSRTFDLGVEQRLWNGRLRAEATLFHHDYRDQIAYQVVDFSTFEGTYVNLGRTRARGAELSLEAAPRPGVLLSADYTYLDGEVLATGDVFDPVYAAGQTLLRRPRHQASLSASGRAGRMSGGATLVLVGRRADSDFLGLGLLENDGYARLDARVRVELGHGLEAFAVAENLLDADHQEALGYPALGRAVRVGLRFKSAS